ncbi:MAG: hypothetical protein VYA69_00350 [Gemmatimonadota bacterium]|nr:hypothetical protein [Gemmatimonadota bacterium]
MRKERVDLLPEITRCRPRSNVIRKNLAYMERVLKAGEQVLFEDRRM